MNKLFKYFELIFIFIIILIYNIFFVKVDADEVWCFGFIYNTVSGLVPYKDFNLVVGPFYPYFFSIFQFIFGNNVLVFEIVNALLFTCLFCIIKKVNNISYYFVFAILLIFSKPNYNSVCLLLFYLILYIELFGGKRNYLIGFLIGIVFLIKFNVGLFLLLPSLFIKEKKNVFKRLMSFCLILLLFLLFLQEQNSLYEYINYCFLGMFDFANKNFEFSAFGYFVFAEIIIIMYLIFIKKDNINILIYYLCFLIISFPILEVYHVILSIIPFFGYLVNKINISVNIYNRLFYIFIAYFLIFNFIDYFKNDLTFDDKSSFCNYRLCETSDVYTYNYITTYLKNVSSNYDIYIFDYSSYILKIESNIPINKFDLINNGNMGYKGHFKYIEEIDDNCNNNKCLFFLNSDLLNNNDTQINSDIIKYVVDNYKYKEKLLFLDVYEN